MARYELVDDVPAAPKARYEVVDEKPGMGTRAANYMNNLGTLPANAGLANFAASVAGLPVDLIEGGINLTRKAQGAIAKAVDQPDYIPPMLSGSFGGSQSLKGILRSTGMPGLSPDNPSQTPMGKAQYDLTSRGGFLPGGFVPAAGSMIAEKIGGPQWAGVGALAPQAAISGFNALRAPALAAQESRNAVRDATLREGREAGLVAPPSATGGGPVSNFLESFGGKAATGQKAALKNQEVVTDLARKDLGLAPNAPVSMQAIENRIREVSAPYREVARISPEADAALKQLKQARFDANANFKFYNHTPNPEVLAKAKALDADAKGLELQLEGFARAAGKPELIAELRDARTQIAKAHDVERALNLGTGQVSPPALGRAIDAGKPLSGGLATAGRFQQAFPQFMREGERVPSPDISATNLMASGALGYGGFQALGPAGTALAALPFARGAARGVLLSKPMQNAMMPSYTPSMTPTPNPQLLYQLGILERQQQ